VNQVLCIIDLMNAQAYIQSRVASAPSGSDEGALLLRISELFSKKLWHQLTQLLIEVSQSHSIDGLIELYEKFIVEFANKLNPVSFVKIITNISRYESKDSTQSLALLLPLIEPKSLIMGSLEAQVLLMSDIARIQLDAGDQSAAKNVLESARELLDAANEVAPETQAAFYASAASFHKIVGTATEFYRNALLFLAYVKADALSVDEKRRWAFDLAVAALVGEEIFNFGELLTHSVLKDLKGTDLDWLLKLLRAFDHGDLDQFDSICAGAADQMNAQPILVANAELMRQKITILALLDLAFQRSSDRKITFVEVSERCRLPLEEVDFLLMRALSLKLISGEIDGVEDTVTITRVVPRVVDRSQVADMSDRLETWCTNVDKTLKFFESESAELFA